MHPICVLICTCICAAASLRAAEPAAAALLEAGAYHCATTTTDGGLDLFDLTIERDGETVRAAMSDRDAHLSGRLIGQRLYLSRTDISDMGMEIVQVIGTIRDDGTVRGSAVRTLDGIVIERGVFTLRRLR